MHRLYHQSQNVYHRVFPLLEINSILSLLKSQCVLIRTKSLLHNGCKWEHSPRYTEKSLWLFRHRIFVSVLNVSDVPPCGIVGFSEVEILVRFNTLWPSKGYGTLSPSDSVAMGPVTLMGRCPHPTLPEYCYRPYLLGYHSQWALLAPLARMGRSPRPLWDLVGRFFIRPCRNTVSGSICRDTVSCWPCWHMWNIVPV